MSTTIFTQTEEVLSQSNKYKSSDGKLLRNAVLEAAEKMDAELLSILLKNDLTKKTYFTEVNDIQVFDKQKFAWIIQNKNFLPDSYTRYKNKIGLVDSRGDFISSSNDVELVFPYKDCILEGGQTKEEQKNNEIFYNETLAPDQVSTLLAPKAFCNAKKYDKDGVHELTEISETDNLIIKGNNLLVISSLLKKYRNSIDCIYIDPPYNPTSQANTFSYNNSFNHSSWLLFMKNRLHIANQLLKKDGVLIVAIDKNEQAYLQVLIEEIFPDRDVDCITIIHNPRGTMGTNFSYSNEFAIFVTPKGKKSICDRHLKNDEIDWSPLRNWGGESLRTDAKNCFYPIIIENEKIIGFGDVTPDNIHPKKNEKFGNQYYIYPIDNSGIERKWRYARQTVETIISNLRIKQIEDNLFDIELGKDYGTYKTVWTDAKYDASTNGSQLLKKINPKTRFSYPKSLYNVEDCISSVVLNNKNAVVLDFFGGSGTTGHAVQEINRDGGNRKFILVEQMDYIQSETLQRNLNVMKNESKKTSIVYCELAKLNQSFADKIQSCKTDSEIKSLTDEILKSDFVSSKVKPSEINTNVKDYSDLSLEEKQKFAMELLDKNQLYVNFSERNDPDMKLSENDIKFTESFYGEKK